MTLRDDIRAYQAGQAAAEAAQRVERSTASFELRWQQLNAAYGMAKALGLLRPDPSEAEVWERWAMLKTQATNQTLET